MIRQSFLSFCLAIALWIPVAGFSGTTTTPQIVAQTTTAAFSCMRWMPIGTCFWLRCSWTGCSVRTSIKVGHYNPDLVVSTYNELGGNPWTEIRATLGLAQKTAATGLLGALLPVPIVRLVVLVAAGDDPAPVEAEVRDAWRLVDPRGRNDRGAGGDSVPRLTLLSVDDGSAAEMHGLIAACAAAANVAVQR